MSNTTKGKGKAAAADSGLSKEERIKLAQTKYTPIFVIEVEDKFAILMKPPRAIYGKAIGHMTPIPGMKNDPDPVAAGIALVLGCWIDGDPEIKSDDDYLLPAAMQSLGLIKNKTASLEKR